MINLAFYLTFLMMFYSRIDPSRGVAELPVQWHIRQTIDITLASPLLQLELRAIYKWTSLLFRHWLSRTGRGLESQLFSCIGLLLKFCTWLSPWSNIAENLIHISESCCDAMICVTTRQQIVCTRKCCPSARTVWFRGAGTIALKLRDFTREQIASRAPRGLRLPERDPMLIRPLWLSLALQGSTNMDRAITVHTTCVEKCTKNLSNWEL